MIDSILAILTILGCCVGLLFAWSSNPIMWYGFSALFFALLAVWCGLRLVCPEKAFAGETTGTARIVALIVCLVPCWGFVQLTAGWSMYRWATEVDSLRWLAFAGVYFLASRLPGPLKNGTKTLITLYSFGLITLSLLDLMTDTRLFGLTTWRSAGTFLNTDHFATFSLLMLPLAACEIVRRGANQPLFMVATATMAAAVVGSQSRAGLAILGLELVAVPLLLYWNGTKLGDRAPNLRPLGAAGIVALAFTLIVGWEATAMHLQTLSADADVRLKLWQSSANMFAARPWTGFGLGTWAHQYPAYALFDIGRYANAAHSDWFQWAAEGGVPMVLGMVLLFGLALRTSLRQPWAFGLVAVLLHCAVDFPMQGKFLPCMFWVVFGLAANAKTAPVTGSRLV